MNASEFEAAMVRALAPMDRKMDRIEKHVDKIDGRLFSDKDSIAVEITEQRERLVSLSDKVTSLRARKPSRFNWKGLTSLAVAVLLTAAGIFGRSQPSDHKPGPISHTGP